MTVKTITDLLKKEYPPQLAMGWDNPGLQVGRMEYEVRKVYVALDATDAVIQECVSWGADLLVTHHPLLMSGIKSVSSENYLGQKALTLAEHRIAQYAMHTNYDVTSMRELAAEKLHLSETGVLEPTDTLENGSTCGIGCVGMLPEEMTAEKCCAYIKEVFHLDSVRLYGDAKKTVRKMAVCPGSGKSVVGEALAAGADIYVTGDIGHHDGIDAVDQGLIIIDAGHYGVEHIFISQMGAFLREKFPELEVREAQIMHPFVTI